MKLEHARNENLSKHNLRNYVYEAGKYLIRYMQTKQQLTQSTNHTLISTAPSLSSAA